MYVCPCVVFSGSGDDTTDKSAAQSVSTTDVSLADGNGSCGNGLSGQNSFELCQQVRTTFSFYSYTCTTHKLGE